MSFSYLRVRHSRKQLQGSFLLWRSQMTKPQTAIRAGSTETTIMATQKVVVEGSSNVTASQLKDLFRQIGDGSITGDHLQAFLGRRNPFEVQQKTKRQDSFTLATGDGRSAKQLLAAGNFDYVGDYARMFVEEDSFPINTDKDEFDIEYVEFDYDPTSEQVLAQFKKLGLLRPQPEDALRFGEKYPEEQRTNPIVFLHEPWSAPDGNRNVLYLNRNGSERNVDMRWFGGRWPRDYRFAARRPRNFLHFSPVRAGEFCFASWPYHPPSCLPTSSSGTDSATYFLFSSVPVSQSIMSRIFAVSSFLIASRTYACFSIPARNVAEAIASITSTNSASTRRPSVYR